MNKEKKKVNPQTMKLKQKKFVILAEVILCKIESEIKNPAYHKKDCMICIKEEVEKMKDYLSMTDFQPAYPLQIVDQWHPQDKLGDILLKLYYDYLEL